MSRDAFSNTELAGFRAVVDCLVETLHFRGEEIVRLEADRDAQKVRAEIAEGETERQREQTRATKRELDELRASIGEWSSASELQVENVFALLNGYPRAVAVLRKAIR